MPFEVQHEDYLISTDAERLDLDVIHGFLRTAYWSTGVPRSVVERAIRHSCCFGLYHLDKQIGFARVITDYTTMAYLSDVFVLEPYRGKGLALRLVRAILAHPDLQGLRRWLLATRDAHELYRRAGFVPLRAPERWMEIHDAEIYNR